MFSHVSQPAPLVTVLSCGQPSKADQAFGKFARLLGLQTELILLSDELVVAPQALQETVAGGRILAFGAATIKRIFRQEWFGRLLNETSFAFAYDFSPTEHALPELQWLTGGALTSVSVVPGIRQQITVHANVTHGSFPVSGKSYEVDSGPIAVFAQPTPDSRVESYLSVAGQPPFVAVKRGSSMIFLLAGTGLVDIDTPLIAGDDSLRPWYAQLIALSIGLRSAAGPWCWTSPVTAANFIVDDPYLKKRYGFIEYEKLTGCLQETGAALTIAFIPYNHRRSDRKTVDLLLRHASRFSIAVHGNDHTGGEYARLDETWLTSTTGCALDRMDDHTRRTGMPFDNVMVFPQGRFSTQAMRALKRSGMIAAVNSSAWPADRATNPMIIRDLLQVAVTRYDNFPLFVRRYPRESFDFAFDALFQKPVLAVEHHGYFREGYEPLTQFVRELATLKTNLVWMPLGQAVASSCLIKQTGEGRFAVQHLTGVLRLRNPTASEVHLALEKPEPTESVKAVIVDGAEVPFALQAGQLEYKATLAAGAELNVTVVYTQAARAKRKISWKYWGSVTARRLLSDIRDNYLARNEGLLRLAEKMKRFLNRK